MIEAIAEHGKAKGTNVDVLDVSRPDWLRNAAGLLDLKYWRGELEPLPTTNWYMDKLDAKIAEATATSGGGPITLLAHSAGGWLGRVYLREIQSPDICGVDRFVCLGSPHRPPPPGVVDQTRGILTWLEGRSPGAFHSPDVSYVTICGRAIKGIPLRASEGSAEERITGLGYRQVCGEAEVWGDGIVPVETAHLPGAHQVDLDGVYHSPIGRGERPWYGTPGTLEIWVDMIYTTNLTDAAA